MTPSDGCPRSSPPPDLVRPDADEVDCKPLALIVVYDDESDVTDYTLAGCVAW